MRLLDAHAEKIVVVPNGCHIWIGSLRKDGYGCVRVPGAGTQITHRVAYQHARGEIPRKLVIDHLCRERACVNPDHMEAVTHAENVRRGESGAYLKARTHCPQGHPYSGENLYVTPKGKRMCRSCNRLASRAYRARKRDEARV
jgi:hypothetical protein